MKMHIKSSLLFIFMMFIISFTGTSQDKKEGYLFKEDFRLPATSVKNQYRSGTCWSFSGLSFLESELLRSGKGEYDLSEMFVVRMTYYEKAIKYVRMHGHNNFAAGGEFHDIIHVIKKYGIVPEEVYPGLLEGESKHIHGEMDEVLADYVKGVIKNRNKKLSKEWIKGLEGILDAYLGKVPEKFTYKGKEYTPRTFAESLGLNWDDYVGITSFTHHPFYTSFAIEIPDNWAWGEVYNVPLDDMMEIINNALKKGYTVAWASDVSEKGFNWKKGIAIVPEKDFEDLTDLEQARWSEMTPEEKDALIYHFNQPGKEKTITQELRQEAFDNYTTTDDHGMHIVGMAHDQNGTLYYIVKNSWGSTGHIYDGYFYASEAFVRYKTTLIMVNKHSIPARIRKKLDMED